MAEVQLEGVQTGPDPINVVEEPYVPDGENQGEQAVRAVSLWRKVMETKDV